MVDFIVAIVMGGIIGWLASIVMNRDASMGIFMNIIVGVVGSFIGSFIARMFNSSASLTNFDIVPLAFAFLGAVVLLGIANLIQRGKVR